MRVIVRKERPHPGAQLRFTDLGGHRFRVSRPRPGPVSSLTWNCGTAAGPAARTASATPRTPGCGTCPARLRPEPDLVPDRRAGLRTARLDTDARPARTGPPVGTKTTETADLQLRRADRPRRPPPAASPGCPVALDTRYHRRHRPPSTPWHPADQTAPSQRLARSNTGARGNPAYPARQPGHQPRPAADKQRASRQLRPSTQDQERSRLVMVADDSEAQLTRRTEIFR